MKKMHKKSKRKFFKESIKKFHKKNSTKKNSTKKFHKKCKIDLKRFFGFFLATNLALFQ